MLAQFACATFGYIRANIADLNVSRFLLLAFFKFAHDKNHASLVVALHRLPSQSRHKGNSSGAGVFYSTLFVNLASDQDNLSRVFLRLIKPCCRVVCWQQNINLVVVLHLLNCFLDKWSWVAVRRVKPYVLVATTPTL